jgi:hypothetical protein
MVLFLMGTHAKRRKGTKKKPPTSVNIEPIYVLDISKTMGLAKKLSIYGMYSNN